MTAEWDLPPDSRPANDLHLNLDELLLLDWMLTPCSNIYPQASVDTAMTWQGFRLSVMDCIAIYDRQPRSGKGVPIGPHPVPVLAISQSEANVLLALCPVEFRWGTGDNCGLSLKLKLRAYLRGEKEETNANDSATSGAAQTDG